MRQSFSFLAALSLVAFAEAAPKKPEGPVEIKAKIVDDLSSEYFGYFDLEVVNKTDRWLVLRNIELVFSDSIQAGNVRVVSGKEFEHWQGVMQKRIARNELNKNTSLAAIGALGYGLAAFSGNQTLQNVGAVAAAGAGGAYVGSEYSKKRDSVQQTKRYPENHLLGDSIVVLPGLSEGRWLLLNSTRHDDMKLVSGFLINFTVDGDGAQSSKIAVGKTPWQKSLWWNPNFDNGGWDPTGVRR